MAMGSSTTQMETITQASLFKEFVTVKVDSSLQTVTSTKVIGLITSNAVTVF